MQAHSYRPLISSTFLSSSQPSFANIIRLDKMKVWLCILWKHLLTISLYCIRYELINIALFMILSFKEKQMQSFPLN